jgi:hypothetical protein
MFASTSITAVWAGTMRGVMMKRLNRRTFIGAGLSASAAAFARWDTRPDSVLYNGRILTMGA